MNFFEFWLLLIATLSWRPTCCLGGGTDGWFSTAAFSLKLRWPCDCDAYWMYDAEPIVVSCLSVSNLAVSCTLATINNSHVLSLQ